MGRGGGEGLGMGREKSEVKERLDWAAISRHILGKAEMPCQWAKEC